MANNGGGKLRRPSELQAATVIGKHARGVSVRRQQRRQEDGAVKMQGIIRGRQARKQARKRGGQGGYDDGLGCNTADSPHAVVMRRTHRPALFDEGGALHMVESYAGALFRYHRDRWIGHGVGQIQFLAVCLVVILVLGGLLGMAVDAGSGQACVGLGADGVTEEATSCSFPHSVWLAWTFMSDMGTHASSGTTSAKRGAYFVMVRPLATRC